ncbi:MAG: hypothetical protein AAF517_19005 [Planctomycetota bacterium]
MAPKIEEILLFDEEVVTPLLAIRKELQDGRTIDEVAEDLEIVRAIAAVFDYQLVEYLDRGEGASFFLLAEAGDTPKRNWGSLVLRIDGGKPFAIEVPRPLLEGSSFEYAVKLFFSLKASVFLVSGAHPWSNEDGSADVANGDNAQSIFHLMHQVVIREARDEKMFVLQTRAFGGGRSVLSSADVMFSTADGCSRVECLSGLSRSLVNVLVEGGLAVQLVQGFPHTAGYEASGSVQAHYPLLLEDKEFGILWLSPILRSTYRSIVYDAGEQDIYSEAGVATVEGELFSYLENGVQVRALDADQPSLSEESLDVALQTIDTGDLVGLRALELRQDVATIERFIEKRSRQAFLVVWPQSGFPVVFRLGSYVKEERFVCEPADFSRETVDSFRRSLSRRFEVQRAP